MPVTGETLTPLNPKVHVSSIGQSQSKAEVSTWQQELASAVRTPEDLCSRLGLSIESVSSKASETFPVVVTESFLKRMEVGNPRDPLLLQVLPVAEEEQSATGFVSDPTGDLQAQSTEGLLRKYTGRALLVLTGTCAIHCRYCFRREFPYDLAPKSLAAWELAFEEIAADETLSEVILSGGDPLVWNDHKLQQLVDRIEQIPHVQRLRIHSRIPIVLPNRITEELIQTLHNTRLQVVMVIHSNHRNELQGDCLDQITRLQQQGIPLLNQAVLLRGINDSVEALVDLCEHCANFGVMPYYLHQLDRVSGASHFEVPMEEGKQLVDELRKRLPGYAVPRYVQEVPGALSKQPIE
ncbi:L-lysine 2,3-aminomutase [Thalassoglobus neptunius]|uniref:L-lysine 2,3-aminomutase n=1 Tax=Thalassoglobus neptunius TaxID=1938619 RepID=A0A5C5X636_9PLAN|nr:EF-P beta-lysylation protein EpmB [Thalassoglobus neptunius]TWT58400.1 L-lysine 2,3-aminomutase [Thalassoglobus neptunius]